MVTSKGGGGNGDKQRGGGNGDKQGRGEGVVITESASSEEGRTYWWALNQGKQMVGRTLVAVHRGGRQRRLIVVIRFVVVHCCRRPVLSVMGCCSSFAAVRRSFTSVTRCYMVLHCWRCIWRWVKWMVVGVRGFRGHRLSFAGYCILCASLLPLLGSHGVALGGCCRSWTSGTV